MNRLTKPHYLTGTCRTCGRSFSYQAQSIDGRSLAERDECNSCWCIHQKEKALSVTRQPMTPEEFTETVNELYGPPKRKEG